MKMIKQGVVAVLIGLSAACELLPEPDVVSGYQTQVIQKVGDKCPSGYGNGRGAYCYSIRNMQFKQENDYGRCNKRWHLVAASRHIDYHEQGQECAMRPTAMPCLLKLKRAD